MRFSYTRVHWSNLFDDSFSSVKWLFIKIAVMFMLFPVFSILFNYLPHPTGLWSLLNINLLHYPSVKIGIAFFIAVLLVLYLLEKYMIWTTALLFIASVLVFSIKESNGIMSRAGLVSLVLIAQCAAYFFHHFNKNSNLNYDRIQFSLQFIVAMYMLAAISKWNDSGLYWIIDAPKIALQIQKSYDYAFVTNGDFSYHEKGRYIAEWITSHPLITRLLMASALLLETFSCLMLINRKWAFFYGILLLGMHLGIMYTMDISSFMMPLVIFCFNPLFLLYTLVNNTLYTIRDYFSQKT